MAKDKGNPKFQAPLDLSWVCSAPDAPWDKRNDLLAEAIMLSNSRPVLALEQIQELLGQGININARHTEGHTVLELAKYYECPLSVVAILTYAGQKGIATVDNAAAPHKPADPATVIHPVPIEFHGTAREYFRIWAVNLCLTLLTLGIFSAWAKVRKKRYFYSHTTLDGTPFQYLGQPIPIFKGRVIAVILYLVWYVSNHFFPGFLPYVVIAALVLLPWAITHSAAFNARYSAFRNITFGFDGNYRDTFLVAYIWGVIPVFVIAGVTIWRDQPEIGTSLLGLFIIIFPFWISRLKRYLVEHTVYGGQKGELAVRGWDFFWIYFVAGWVAGIAAFAAGIIVYATGNLLGESEWTGGMTAAALLPGYLSYLVAYAYAQAKSSNLVWNNIKLGALQFQSVIPAGGFVKLYLINVLAIVTSLGLLIPWAVIRTFKYRAEHMRGLLKGDYSLFRGSESTKAHAAGAEVSEIFNMDLSL